MNNNDDLINFNEDDNDDNFFDDEGDDDFQEYEKTTDQYLKLKFLVEEAVEAVLLKYGVISGTIEPKYVSLEELSEGLGVSRQTINKWVNHRYMKIFFNPHKKNLGNNRFVYNLEAIRRSLIKDGAAFGIRDSELYKIRSKEKTR